MVHKDVVSTNIHFNGKKAQVALALAVSLWIGNGVALWAPTAAAEDTRTLDNGVQVTLDSNNNVTGINLDNWKYAKGAFEFSSGWTGSNVPVNTGFFSLPDETTTILTATTANFFGTVTGTRAYTIDPNSSFAKYGITISYYKISGVKVEAYNGLANAKVTYYSPTNIATLVTLGNITWDTSAAAWSPPNFIFNADTAIDASNLTFNGTATTALKTDGTSKMTLLSGVTGAENIPATNITQPSAGKGTLAVNYTNNEEINFTATASGEVTVTTNQVDYTINNVTISGVDLADWNGTTSTVPDGWTAKADGVSVTGDGFVAPSITTGNSVNILTTGTNGFFSNANVSDAIKFKENTGVSDAAKGVTLLGNESKGVKATEEGKNLIYERDFTVNEIALGSVKWDDGRAFTGTVYSFDSLRKVDATNLSFVFTDGQKKTLAKDSTMVLLSNANGLPSPEGMANKVAYNNSNGYHTQAIDLATANGSALTGGLEGTFTYSGNNILFKTNSMTLDAVDLSSWDGTKAADAVPAGWTANSGGVSVTANSNFAPNIDAGSSKNILTATTGNYFSNDQIADAIKYKALAANSDTVSGVTLTGSESKGVKASADGKALVYERSNFNVSNISFGTMAWDTGRTASGTGYDYSNAAINLSGLTFSNPEAISAGTTTLLTANNTLGDIAETTKNISYGYSPVSGVTVDGIINGNYKATGGILSYTATDNKANKLTFGNVAWTGGDGTAPGTPLMTRPDKITFAGADVDTSNINFTNIQELEANKTMTLVADFGDSVGTISGTKYKVGSTLQGEGKASLVDSDEDGIMDALIFTTDTRVEKMTVQEQTHNTVMGAEVGMAALSAGNDFVGTATEGLAMAGNAGADGMATYANMGGGSMNVETGSHVKTHTWNAILALGHKNEKQQSSTEYGAFFEYGTGNYSTFNGEERGDGSTHYTGGGILGKWQKNNGFYVEGSLRAGSIHDDATNVLRDVNGVPYSYNTNAPYWGAHIGVGKELKLTNTDTWDIYAKYFYNHRGSVSFDAGGHYDLDAVESSVLRLGTRYTVKKNDKINYYGGIALEHEFCGRAAGLADGVAIRGADIGGTSVRGEIGATFRPGEKSNVTLDLNLSGFAGKKRGLTGGISAKFHF